MKRSNKRRESITPRGPGVKPSKALLRRTIVSATIIKPDCRYQCLLTIGAFAPPEMRNDHSLVMAKRGGKWGQELVEDCMLRLITAQIITPAHPLWDSSDLADVAMVIKSGVIHNNDKVAHAIAIGKSRGTSKKEERQAKRDEFMQAMHRKVIPHAKSVG